MFPLAVYGDDMKKYRKWEDNIKIDLKEICVDLMTWMELANWRILDREIVYN